MICRFQSLVSFPLCISDCLITCSLWSRFDVPHLLCMFQQIVVKTRVDPKHRFSLTADILYVWASPVWHMGGVKGPVLRRSWVSGSSRTFRKLNGVRAIYHSLINRTQTLSISLPIWGDTFCPYCGPAMCFLLIPFFFLGWANSWFGAENVMRLQWQISWFSENWVTARSYSLC